MNHEGSVTLETERLVLRPFTPDDADAVYRNWAGDREATRFMPYERASSVEEARNLISRWSDRVFALVLKSTGELIGFVEYDITDEEARAAELAYLIGRNWWHNGYVAEALAALLKYVFEVVGLNRVWADYDPRNPNSGAVMRKSGLRYAGLSRQCKVRDGALVDRYYYEILAAEYFGEPAKGKIICIHGTVCSGKTHYAKRLARQRHAVVLSHDEISVPLLGLYPERMEEHYQAIRGYFFKKALEIMECGTPVILDWGFWNRADRRETTEYFAQHGYAVEWHGIAITGEALRRNVQSRNAEIAAGRSDAYPADEGLLAKAAALMEKPAGDEMDVWVAVE